MSTGCCQWSILPLSLLLTGCPELTPDSGSEDSGIPDSGIQDSGIPDGGLACASGTSGTYTGVAMQSQTAAFEVVFEVTPAAAGIGAAVALASGARTNLVWTDLAAIVRFDLTNRIDVRNGGAYEALVSMSYVPGSTYRVRAAVDVLRHVYSVYVTPPSGAEQLLAADYAFRTGNSPVASLDQWGIMSDTGSLNVCLVSSRAVAPLVAVTVTPASATVQTGANKQFTAAVTGSTNTNVTWTVVQGSGCGTITSDGGLYTAPGTAGTCQVRATSVADTTRWGTAVVAVVPAGVPSGDYPFGGYTDTRGAFETMVDGGPAPRLLVVDRLSGSTADGDATTGRGSLPWALTRSYPRVVLFEISGVINVGNELAVTSPYVSVHGQTAPSPGITLNNVSVLIRTHDVIFQHLRVRMGETEIGGGDPLGVCGASGGTAHDIVIDHCSAGLGHDEQLSISACAAGDVRRVTLSNNIISFGLNYAGHAFGTLIDSGGSNAFAVDEILVDGNLFSNVTFRTPLINTAARRVTVTNNTTYNALYYGMRVNSAQYPEGQFVDMMNNLYWRGPETHVAGTWPTNEATTWPAQPDVWPWDPNRRWVGSIGGPAGNNTHIYYADNYDYVNNQDYLAGNHEGRPVRLEHEWYSGGISATDVRATSRQTALAVALMSPLQVETHVQLDVGCTPDDRDPLDALSVSDAFNRTGGYIDHVVDLSVAPLPPGGASRSLGSISGYPAGGLFGDADGDGLTNLEEWIYGL